jgi:hypothetical protein
MNTSAELNVTCMAQRPDYGCASLSISAKQIIEGKTEDSMYTYTSRQRLRYRVTSLS